jgi:hypothetical protein
MGMNVLHQLVQSGGQFLAVFITGMLVYKNWSDVQAIGVMNAIYQPALQGVLASLGIYGISKIKIGGSQ